MKIHIAKANVVFKKISQPKRALCGTISVAKQTALLEARGIFQTFREVFSSANGLCLQEN